MSKHHDDSVDEIIVNKFTEESAKEFRKQVLKKSATNHIIPITVYIDSYGGYVDALNSMLATMRSVSNEFITVCIGKAMSCGAVLLSAGDYRFCDKDARVMIHEVSAGAFGTNDNIKNSAKETDRLNKQLMTFIAKRCGKSYDQLKKSIKDNDADDLYLTASEALNFGVVDFVGLPNLVQHVQYELQTLPEKKYEPLKKQQTKKKTRRK
jgi:ATP-dependent Clp protease protease subunit